jgi:hypothetical protein
MVKRDHSGVPHTSYSTCSRLIHKISQIWEVAWSIGWQTGLSLRGPRYCWRLQRFVDLVSNRWSPEKLVNPDRPEHWLYLGYAGQLAWHGWLNTISTTRELGCSVQKSGFPLTCMLMYKVTAETLSIRRRICISPTPLANVFTARDPARSSKQLIWSFLLGRPPPPVLTPWQWAP